MSVIYTRVCLYIHYLKQIFKIFIQQSIDITWYAEEAIYAKKLFFSHSIVS